MEMGSFEELTVGAVAVVPVIVAVVQALKMLNIPNKYSPILSIGVGVIVGFLFRHESQDITQTILAGVLYGLSASGLYSGVKSTTETIKAEKTEGTF